jgi:multimeric flavodoxin WrbA
MRVLGICGSPRGRESTTRKLIEQVLEGAKSAGAEVELIDLSQIDVGYCTACGACHITGNCVVKDDFEPVRRKMLACDGLVLGSPVYFNTVTAQLKSVLDRLSSEIHCQEFLGKYACSIASAGGPEFDLVNDYLNGVLVRLGCSVVGGVGASMSIPGSFDTAQQESLALGRELVEAIEQKQAYPQQEPIHAAMHVRFKRLVGSNKDNWPHEYENWHAKGWM